MVYLVYCDFKCSGALPCGAVGCPVCVIVVFPDYTHFSVFVFNILEIVFFQLVVLFTEKGTNLESSAKVHKLQGL